jgi:hypothetical protein
VSADRQTFGNSSAQVCQTPDKPKSSSDKNLNDESQDCPEARYSQQANWKRNNDKSLQKQQRTKVHRLHPSLDG